MYFYQRKQTYGLLKSYQYIDIAIRLIFISGKGAEQANPGNWKLAKVVLYSLLDLFPGHHLMNDK